MRRFISRNVEDIAAEKIISSYDKDVKEIVIDAKDNELTVEVR
jgi:hypothetical protein